MDWMMYYYQVLTLYKKDSITQNIEKLVKNITSIL